MHIISILCLDLFNFETFIVNEMLSQYEIYEIY